MTISSCLILFGLCLVFLCEGKVVYAPPNSLVVKPGSTVNLQWSFDDKIETVATRTWNFVPISGSSILALIVRDNDPDIFNQSLTFEIKKPATLILKNVTEIYNGKYQFSLKLPSKAYPVSEVMVVIAMTPKMKIECSRATTINKGKDITCVCSGEDGNPPANVTWFDEDGEKVSKTGKEKATLTLRNVDGNDSGKYKCKAFGDKLAQNETSIKLTVRYRPENVRVVLPLDIAVRGKSFTIKCEAEAEPVPTFKMFFNKTEVPIINDTFIIPKVNDSHVGFYECIANNTLGLNASTPRYLRVGNAGTHGNDVDAKGLSTGAIVGIIIGVLVLVLVVAIICLLKLKKKNHGHERVKNDNPMKTPSGSTSNQPHEYAVLEKPEPVTYAALDKKDLKQGGPEKPARTHTPTVYADIQVP